MARLNMSAILSVVFAGKTVACRDAQRAELRAALVEARDLLPNDNLGSVPMYRDDFNRAIRALD